MDEKDRKIGGGGDGKDTSRHRGRTLPAGGRRVREMLHISKRTLQTLRDEGAIPYTTIGGKILYPESALYETLRKNYRTTGNTPDNRSKKKKKDAYPASPVKHPSS